ncbi:MAG: N-acetyltransferase family protein [Granulosicoccus sp.]
MKCRNATMQDVPQACHLLNEIIEIGGTTAFEKALEEEEFSSIFLTGDDCIVCIVCEDDTGIILGFQVLLHNDLLQSGWADIATFARVSQKVRGVGTSLFNATRQFAQSSDVPVINATIRADNQSGLAYYTKMGFVDYHTDKAVPLNDGTPVDRISKRYDV